MFFGQPVQYGDRSFIRLAIGAYAVRAFLEEDAIDLHNDYRTIEIIEEYAQKMLVDFKIQISKIIADFNAVVDQKDTSVLVAHLPSLHERLKHLKSSFPASCIVPLLSRLIHMLKC